MCRKTFTKIKSCDFREYPENSKFYEKVNKK